MEDSIRCVREISADPSSIAFLIGCKKGTLALLHNGVLSNIHEFPNSNIIEIVQDINRCLILLWSTINDTSEVHVLTQHYTIEGPI